MSWGREEEGELGEGGGLGWGRGRRVSWGRGEEGELGEGGGG